MITDTITMTGVATTRSRSFNRIAAISGLAFVVCAVTSLILVGDGIPVLVHGVRPAWYGWVIASSALLYRDA